MSAEGPQETGAAQVAPYRPERHTLLFIGGLHRSGTTPLAKTLGRHPRIAPLRGTGVKKNEGQHLQSVYPPAQEHGGPGRFALEEGAHLTEESPLATEETARLLWEAWAPYWNLRRRILLEKSPPNLVMTRFLNRVFPTSRQLLILRHPVVVALATAKWMERETPVELVEHWVSAHELLRRDLEHLDSAAVITYEALVRRPAETLDRVCAWLGVPGGLADKAELEQERSAGYEETWAAMADPSHEQAAVRRELVDRLGDRVAAFGYDLEDLGHEGDHGLPRP